MTDYLNPPARRRLKAISYGAAAVVLIAVWNLWWRHDPLFFLGLLDPRVSRPGPWPPIWWMVPVGIVVVTVIYVLELKRMQRRIDALTRRSDV